LLVRKILSDSGELVAVDDAFAPDGVEIGEGLFRDSFLGGFSLSPCTFPPFVLNWEVGFSRSLLPLLQFLELLLKLNLNPLTCGIGATKGTLRWDAIST
jgi:hypothetical protein